MIVKTEICVLALASAFAVYGKRVSVTYFVTDGCGVPVTNATIRTVAMERLSVLPWSKERRNSFFVSTDCAGRTECSFPCSDGYFDAFVRAPGFYLKELRDLRFNMHWDAAKDEIAYDESHKTVLVNLRRKVNPQKMIKIDSTFGWRIPSEKGTYGFDLEKGAWVAPYGRGQTADILFKHEYRMENGVVNCSGELEFPNGGAYKCIKEKHAFKTVYEADTNACYVNRFPFEHIGPWSDSSKCRIVNAIGENEYLVCRIREVKDLNGNIVSAHYATILGQMAFMEHFCFAAAYFNPRENDTNLEPDSL